MYNFFLILTLSRIFFCSACSCDNRLTLSFRKLGGIFPAGNLIISNPLFDIRTVSAVEYFDVAKFGDGSGGRLRGLGLFLNQADTFFQRDFQRVCALGQLDVAVSVFEIGTKAAAGGDNVHAVQPAHRAGKL